MDVKFSIMSLAVLNQGRDLDPDYRDHIEQTWPTARACAAVAIRYGEATLTDFYTALGTRIHLKQQPVGIDVVKDALSDLNLDLALADEALTNIHDAYLHDKVAEAQSIAGTDVGVPTIGYRGKGMFGPVMSPAPKGQDALDVFDGLLKLMSYPGFYEVKRSRDVGPIFD